MGGDHAPRVVVDGVVQASRIHGPDVEFVLVGREAELDVELGRMSVRAGDPGIRLVAAEEVVEMHESPSHALRNKRASSLHRAIELVADNQVDGVLTAGNTGAAVAVMLFKVGLLEGVDRPALAAVLPTMNGHSLLLDVGATVDCKPQQLLQFAVMGHCYAKTVLGITEPTVGLLSNGQEAGKGNQATREVYKHLEASELNFVGNVEARALYSGDTDVIVCDGFTGNLVLKASESLVDALTTTFRRECEQSVGLRLAVGLTRGSLQAFKRRWDYTEVGGVPMLGLDRPCIICHGHSNAKSIRNALGVAREFVEGRVNERIQENLQAIA